MGLVLTRRLQEGFLLVDEATGRQFADIRLVRVRSGEVRLLIEAPPEVAIVRAELADLWAADRQTTLETETR